MSFLGDIMASVRRKQADYKERNEFLAMVEAEAKPIRRAAYMQQILKEVVNEGIEKAKVDSAKKMQKKKAPEDFGIKEEKKEDIFSGLKDPYKYLKTKEGK